MNTAVKLIFTVLLLSSCQQVATRVTEESEDTIAENVVLLDTRSDLDFSSFHVEGAKHLAVREFLNPSRTNGKSTELTDLDDLVLRLSIKGVSPGRTIYLIGDKKNSLENKKWNWLLYYLGVKQVKFYSMDEVLKMRNGRFKSATSASVWSVSSADRQKIYNLFQQCFFNWSETLCSF